MCNNLCNLDQYDASREVEVPNLTIPFNLNGTEIMVRDTGEYAIH